MRIIIATAVVMLAAAGTCVADDDSAVNVAEFDDSGGLIVPHDIDEWVFLGSSLGMGYSQENFDQDSPGMFQIVRMEPRAYKAFLKSGKFVDGAMIALHFYASQNNVSINRAGFVMGDLNFAEIHYKDSDQYPDGFNFFTFQPDQAVAEEVPLPNECVACHQKDGAYDGVFVQFYPTIHAHLPAEVRARLTEKTAPQAH